MDVDEVRVHRWVCGWLTVCVRGTVLTASSSSPPVDAICSARLQDGRRGRTTASDPDVASMSDLLWSAACPWRPLINCKHVNSARNV